MSLKLAAPAERHRDEWKNIVKEFRDANETVMPYSLHCDTPDYSEYLRITDNVSKGIDLKGWVQGDTYFLVDGDNPRILGAVSLRYSLNDYLFRVGGNIGYGIRPAERKKGYAARMLKMALELCRSRGMDRVLITCDKQNIASAKTMLKNGAVLENEVLDGEETVQRYWIAL